MSNKCKCCRLELSEIEVKRRDSKGESLDGFCITCQRAMKDACENVLDLDEMGFTLDDTYLDYEGGVIWPDEDNIFPKGLDDDE